jgi:putative hydrolase of the HAD superfamily
MFDIIAFDADDTLWDNESFYVRGKERFQQILSGYGTPEELEQKLDEVEIGNIDIYGYGIKSFALSMVEAAIQITQGQVPGEEIRRILDITREMLSTVVGLYDRVEETLEALSRDYHLMLITKGDRFEQEKKIARTGLLKYFAIVEIVGDKTEASYREILRRHSLVAERFLMVGNSMRSDILPVIRLGGRAVYIPQDNTWSHENAVEEPHEAGKFYELDHIWQLPALVSELENKPGLLQS